MTSNINIIRVKDCGHAVSGIEFLTKDRATVGKFELSNKGDWKEYQFESGEVIIGVFGQTV